MKIAFEMPDNYDDHVPMNQRSRFRCFGSFMAIVLFWVSIIILCAHSCSAQSKCPPHQPEIFGAIKKPVHYGDIAVELQTCDQDKGQTVELLIIKGDPRKWFKIGPRGLTVNNAKAINRSSIQLYSITVQARDNCSQGRLSSISVVKLLVL